MKAIKITKIVNVLQYGYAPKGSSVLLFRNKKLRQYQYFIHTDSPGKDNLLKYNIVI